MKTNFIISLFLLSLKAFALPGDMSLENFHTDIGCVDTGLSSLEKNLDNLLKVIFLEKIASYPSPSLIFIFIEKKE